MRPDSGKYRLEIIAALLALFGVLPVIVDASLPDTVLKRAQDLVSDNVNVAQSFG